MSEVELKRLVRTRVALRASAKMVRDSIETEMRSERPKREAFDQAIALLDAKENELKPLDIQIQTLLDGTVTEEEFDADLQACIVEIERIVISRDRARRFISKPAPSTPSHSNQQQQQTTTHTSDERTVRLPKLEILKFNGEISKWKSFWGQYKASIHNNERLRLTDKFCYLKGLLEGAAARAIEGLSLTEENYETAINILKERFGRNDLIISAHKNNLLKLPSVRSVDDINGLKKLYDSCEVEVRSLEALNVPQEQFGTFLVHILGGLLPSEMIMEFSRSREAEESEWEVGELLQFIKKEIVCLERVMSVKRSDLKSKDPKQTNEKSSFPSRQTSHAGKSALPTVAALQVAINSENSKQPNNSNLCPICDSSDHNPSNCNLSISDRRKRVLEKKLCFICLRGRHQAATCRYKYRNCGSCGRKHNKALCEGSNYSAPSHQTAPNNQQPQTNAPQAEATTPKQVSSAAAVSSHLKPRPKDEILLQTAMSIAIGPTGTRQKTRIFFDGGSQGSFVTQTLSQKLNLEVVGKQVIDVHKFEGEAPVRTTRKIVRLQLQHISNPTKTCFIQAYEASSICGAIFSVPSEGLIKGMKERGLEVADYPSGNTNNHETPIDILIGSDYFWEIASGKIERLGKALVALETRFGWVVQGPTGITPVSTLGAKATSVNTISVMSIGAEDRASEEESLSSQIRSLWELDAMGIIESGEANKTENDETLNRFETAISFNNGRYQVGFPWKNNKDMLADNYGVALKRTQSLLKRLKASPKLFQEYHDVITEQIQAGIVEEVPPEEEIVLNSDQPVYYIPHQEVIRTGAETTKLRVVQDASSHAAGVPSLNECMESGPSLLPELFDILIRFREHPIALTGDIEKAFHQIEIKPEDRDALRFLWVKSLDNPTQLITYRITRVPFGVTASPFLLSATIRHHARKYGSSNPVTSKILEKNLYVDDLLTGGKNNESTYDLAIDAKQILKDAGMNLRKWRSNSKELKERLGVELELEKQDDTLTKMTSVKVLGLAWQEEEDYLHFDIGPLLQFLTNKGDSKRFVLKAVARIFDPLGFLSPFTIRAKFLIQELWQLGLPWDEKLPEDISNKFTDWCEELPDIRHVRIPRFYFVGPLKKMMDAPELHCFVDASEKAYAAVVYLRYQDETEVNRTVLVASKVRVAPLKKLTLPRLELMGAVIGAKLANRIMEQLATTPSRVKMWTDSTITLHWIRGSANQWKPFVANRVREIQLISDPINWNHCAGKSNPADLPTRGRQLAELSSNHLWLHGPEFLQEQDYKEANYKIGEINNDSAVNEEMRPKCRTVLQIINVTEENVEPLLKLEEHSKLIRVYRVTAWVYRFTNNAKPGQKIKGPLTAEEIAAAEKYWISQAQKESYPSELSDLKHGNQVAIKSSLSQLSPFLDDNKLISVGGRLTSKNFSYREQHPWILSSQHRLSKLITIHHHTRLNHVGVSDTLGEIREQFWIPRAREMVKKELNQCRKCQYFKAKPAATIMAPLPPSRTTPAPVFEICGVDFCGPLYTKDGSKCYVALYTCAVTRAVHLELVSDLTADSFLLSFRRFISRRGMIKTMYSDNAKTFKRADADIAQLWANMKSPEVADYFSTRQVSWKYIADRAAWWGGFWERLVGSVKVALRKVIGLARLTFEEIGTILAEVEATVNSRPITYVYQDSSEPIPLTPAHFLVGRRLTVLPSRVFPRSEPLNVARAELTKRWKYRQTLMERFWDRWKINYLLELRSAHHRTDCKPTKELEVGDVVLVGEPKLPRLMWKMGRIKEAVKGRDGLIRSCVLQLPNSTTMRRPVQLLYRLEC